MVETPAKIFSLSKKPFRLSPSYPFLGLPPPGGEAQPPSLLPQAPSSSFFFPFPFSLSSVIPILSIFSTGVPSPWFTSSIDFLCSTSRFLSLGESGRGLTARVEQWFLEMGPHRIPFDLLLGFSDMPNGGGIFVAVGGRCCRGCLVAGLWCL